MWVRYGSVFIKTQTYAREKPRKVYITLFWFHLGNKINIWHLEIYSVAAAWNRNFDNFIKQSNWKKNTIRLVAVWFGIYCYQALVELHTSVRGGSCLGVVFFLCLSGVDVQHSNVLFCIFVLQNTSELCVVY